MSANLCKGVNSSHTPGPWIVSHDPDACSDDDYCIGVPDGKVDQVAVCSKQDAALISAAPDMYEALRELVDDVCDRVDLDSPSCNPGIKTAVKFARAALAKAVPK